MIFSETSSTGAPRLPADLLICLRVCPDAHYAPFAGFTVAGKTSVPPPPVVPVLVRGDGVLGVGIDWAESFHDVALGRPGEGVIGQFRIEHGPAGVARLVARCLELEPDPAAVRGVLE